MEDEVECKGKAADDIGIDGLAASSLWIRADYIRIYDTLQDYYKKYAKPRAPALSAVLTGQSGIDESRCFAFSA